MMKGRESLLTFPDVTKWWFVFKKTIKRKFPWEGIKPRALKSKIAAVMFKGVHRLKIKVTTWKQKFMQK